MSDYLLTIAGTLDRGTASGDLWQPAGMWVPKVGDRVRCVPSPECRLVSGPGSLQGEAGDIGHEAWETGLTGIIENVLTDDSAEPELFDQGHLWEVLWDAPRQYAGHTCAGASYALGELAPLDADDGCAS